MMVISLDSYFDDMVNDFTDTYSLILFKILPKDLSSEMIDIFDDDWISEEILVNQNIYKLKHCYITIVIITLVITLK